MKIKFLLIGTSLSFIPILSFAQCVETTNCETLGYTETTCNGGKGVKCPFGNKWACLATEESVCADNGFKYACTGTGYSGGSGDSCGGKYKKCSCKSGYKWSNGSCKKSCSSSYKYTCTGTGYAGGAGSACGGKYTQCTCASGYEWKDGSCQKETPTEGVVGDKYYCDGKVVGIRVSGMDFFVAIENAKNGSSETMNWSKAETTSTLAFCGKGRLPTLDELKLIYNNQSKINSLSTAAGGKKLTEGWYWSSTYYKNGYDEDGHYIVYMPAGNMNDYYNFSDTDNFVYVRPVLDSY